jgi:hypothetical protein
MIFAFEVFMSLFFILFHLMIFSLLQNKIRVFLCFEFDLNLRRCEDRAQHHKLSHCKVDISIVSLTLLLEQRMK